jgi:hypothetical protein
MFRGFRLALSASGACAENIEKGHWGKNIEEKAKPPDHGRISTLPHDESSANHAITLK